MQLRHVVFAVIASIGILSPAPAQVVLSQIYGGGGNSGATFKNDFIEVFNRGSAPVSMAGWSVQYAASTASSWQATNLSGTLQPGQYYLIQESQGAGGTTNLPTPDAVGTIAMSATTGKIALVNTTTLLSGTGCPFPAGVVDFIGYGAANCSEGSTAPTLSNTSAALRAGAGCTDTDNNSADFASGAPSPRNTATALSPCSGAMLTITNASPLPNATVGQFYSATLGASGGTGAGYTFSQIGGTLPPGLMLTGATLSGTPNTTSGSPFSFTIQAADSGSNTAQKLFQLSVDAVPTCTPTSTIAQIQGSGNTSPLAGTAVTTSGIVTARKSNGFFMQMPPPGDGDSSTSDGIFVFTSSAPPAAAVAGNSVCVKGTVQEFIPASDPASPSATEIASVTNLFAISTGNALPPPVVLTAATTDPAGALLQLEKYEGMRVQVNFLTVVAPTRGTINESSATATSDGIFYGVIPGIARPFREPGVELPDPLPAGSPCCVPRWDTNPEVLSVNTLGQPGSAAMDVTTGQTVSNIIGPIEFSQRAFTIDPDPATPPVASGAPLSFIAVPQPASGELTVASFNMQRFFDTVDDPPTSDVVLTPTAFNNRLNKASLAIRNVLRYPDILGVEEMENLTTLQTVANKVNNDAAVAGDPNPNYQAFLVEGNDIGGIDVGFLIKTPKVAVVDVTQFGKDTTYIDPGTNSPAILNDRPPLVLRATVTQTGSQISLPVTVIVNHLRSLSGIDDIAGGARVRAKREAQAEYLAQLIQGFQNGDAGLNLVSVGDYNAFQFNDGYVDVMGVIEGTPVPANQVVTPPVTITNPVLTDLIDTAPADQRYSYSFNGNAQELDHILVNQNMTGRVSRYAVARNDADFPEIFRNDPNRPERISDHDMAVAYFTLPLATDASSQVSATASGLLFSRLTRTYNGTVTITNTSQQTIAAPIQAVFQVNTAGVTLANPSGMLNGSPFIAASAAALAPGQSVTFPVRFNNPSNAVIDYSVKTYSGVL